MTKMVDAPEPYRRVTVGTLKGFIVELKSQTDDHVIVRSRWDENLEYHPKLVELQLEADAVERYQVPAGFEQDRSAEFNAFARRSFTALLDRQADPLSPPSGPLLPDGLREHEVKALEILVGDWIVMPDGTTWQLVDEVHRGLWYGEPRVMVLCRQGSYGNWEPEKATKIRRPIPAEAHA